MRPHDDYRNGDDAGSGSRPGSASGSEDGSGGEGGVADELSICDEAAPARALAALNALRKSRQHYDVVLLALGTEVPAHRAVLAAASPYLLEELQTAAAAHRVEQVDAESLRALVEYAYTGRLSVRDHAAGRRLYRAAWRLRVEPARTQLAARLLRRPSPNDCLELRALPDLTAEQLAQLDEYIANNFEEICSSGALASLPVIHIEMLRESSAADGEESPVAVAAAALAWLRQKKPDTDLEELCSHTHLLFVDARGELRDCGELPAATHEAPELGEYRREAAAREKTNRRQAKEAKEAKENGPVEDVRVTLGARVSRGAAGDWGVIAVRAAARGGTRALVVLRGRLAAARVSWKAVGPSGITRGGTLAGASGAKGERRAPMNEARCALGSAVLGGRLLVCGGYDRARVLKTAEAYDPITNTWTPLPDMRCARARFPATKLGNTLFVFGGSDGHAELDSVAALEDGVWKPKAKLPLARGHASAAADERRGELYVVGGWAGGMNLRRVDKYTPDTDEWTEAPPLITGRSQCAGVLWDDTLWALGGCDTWHCLASTESLSLSAAADGAWESGPNLPTARRSMGGGVWRDRLVSAGGSDGSASLKRVDWLLKNEAAWKQGPDLRTPRAGFALAVLNDALYAVGGFDGKQFLACVECLYEPDGEWTTLCTAASPTTPLSPSEPITPNTPLSSTHENGAGDSQ